MSTGAPDQSHESDGELLQRVRAGDHAAFGELYNRHRTAAERMARAMTRSTELHQDLVSEAFASVLDQLQKGRGPTSDFRSYLFACIRNGFRQQLRGPAVYAASDRPWLLDGQVDAPEQVTEVGGDVAVAALASLPEQWRTVLWQLEVEGKRPAELAEEAGVSSASVSAMVYRAREGLRRAYLEQHLPVRVERSCSWTIERLAQLVRGDLSARATRRIEQHLVACAPCRKARDELEEVNARLAVHLWPVVLVGGLPGFLKAWSGSSSPEPDAGTSTTSAAGAAAGAVVGGAAAGAAVGGAAAGGGKVRRVLRSVPGRRGWLLGVAASVALVLVLSVAAALIGHQSSSRAVEEVPATQDLEQGDSAGRAPVELDWAVPEWSLPRPTPSGLSVRAPIPAPPPEPQPEPEPETQPRPEPEPQPEPEPEPQPEPEPEPEPQPEPEYDLMFGSLDLVEDAPGEWTLTSQVEVNSESSLAGLTIETALTFDSDFGLDLATGWSCREQASGGAVGTGNSFYFSAGTTIVCAHQFTDESPPPALVLDLYGLNVTGTAVLSAGDAADPNPGDNSRNF